MFSPSYIAKCIRYKGDIEYLVQQARYPFRAGQIIQVEDLFRPGDAFHHAKTMAPGEYKIIKQVLGHTDIYAEHPILSYPVSESVILPTEELLKAGLEASGWDLEEGVFGKGAEPLLDAIVESGRFVNKGVGTT
jgi:hypothetical protein